MRHARNLLNQAVHAVRKAVGERAIISAGDSLRLDPEVLETDVAAFEAALAAGEKVRSVELYCGPFLDGFHLPHAPEFERWAAERRRSLQDSFRRALEELANQAEEERDPESAVSWWRRRSEDDPYNAQATLHLMRALEVAGDRAGAIEQAAVHEALFQQELEAEPDPAVRTLAARMRRFPRARDATRGTGQAGALSEGRSPPAPDSGGLGFGPWLRDSFGVVGGALSFVVLVAVTLFALGLRAGSTPGTDVAFHAAGEGSSTVAVLPFENLNGTDLNGTFVRGIHTDLITALSRVDGLTVISQGSVFVYGDQARSPTEIGDELGADVIVERGVQRAEERIRVNVQLTDVATGAVRWASRYDGELTMQDIFGVQTEIVTDIVASLHASLTEADQARMAIPPTGDLTAYTYLQQARLAYDGTRSGNEESERLLRLALKLDPDFAPAWAKLAGQYGWRPPYLGVSTTAWDSAVAFARRALESDSGSVEALAALAATYGHQGHLGRQEHIARQALRLNRNESLAWRRLGESYRERGDFDTALQHHRTSVRISPNQLTYRAWVAFVYTDLGDHAAAELWLHEVLALDPDNQAALEGMTLMWLKRAEPDSARHYAEALAAQLAGEPIALSAAALVAHYLNDLDRVEEYAGRAVEIGDGAPARSANSLLAWTFLGFARLQAGDVARAEELFGHSLRFLEARIADGTDTPRWPYEVALIQAVRGEEDRALDSLERAVELGFGWLWMLEREPMLDPLRGEQRFQNLVATLRSGARPL